MTTIVPTSEATAKPYHPQEHLVVLKTPDGPKEYYPFNWQLQEFRLRFPNGVLDAQIVHFDVEHDFVLVRVTASEDDLDHCRGVGLQAGSLMLIDKVTQRAKAQALVDLGIGCPWPIAFEEDLERLESVLAQEQTNAQPDVHPDAELPEAPSPIHNIAQPVPEMNGKPSSNEHKPRRTEETVQAFYAKAYRIAPTELETKWSKFVLGVTGRPLVKGPLSEDELNKLNGIISQAYQKQKTLQPTAGKNGARVQEVRG
jgi:hypothetical protein